jgi:hypothetical protein
MRLLLLLPLILPQPSLDATAADPSPPPVVTKPEIKLPPTIKIRAGRLAVVTAETNGEKVRWVAVGVPREELDLLPVDDSGKVIHFCCEADPAGGDRTVQLLAYTALGNVPSELAVCVITVTGHGPRPPPADNLTTKTQAGFNVPTVPAAQRLDDAKILFRVTSALVLSMQNAPSLTPDVQALHDQFKAALEASGWTRGRYPAITQLIKDAFSADDATFTDVTRKAATSKLQEIANGAKAVITAEGGGM